MQCWWEGKLVQALWEPLANHPALYDPAIPLLGTDRGNIGSPLHQKAPMTTFTAPLLKHPSSWLAVRYRMAVEHYTALSRAETKTVGNDSEESPRRDKR
jgi:hypothetical protein